MTDDHTDRSTPFLMDPRERADSEGTEDDEDAALDPKPAQGDIIASDAYPLRVLAGAGTGKTFTMVRKIRRVLETTPPDDVLALTFTNKAATSIQEKLAETVPERAYDVDAYTYHSIALRLIEDHAYEAGIDPEFDIAGDADRYAIIYNLLDDIEYHFVEPKAYQAADDGDGVEKRLKSFIDECKRADVSPDELVGKDGYLPTVETLIEIATETERIEAAVADTLDSYDGSFKHYGNVAEDRLTFVRELLDDVITVTEDVQHAVRQITQADGAGGTMIDDVLLHLDAIKQFATDYKAMLATQQSTLVAEDNAVAMKAPLYVLGGYGGEPDWVPEGRSLTCLTAELQSFVEECQAAHDLSHGYERYQALLDEHGLLDLQDLVLKAKEIAADPTIAQTIDSEWEYIFCDEFQDTDPIQFELVNELVGDGNLFVVGDDDQAVYEWRGANVENIRSDLTKAYGDAEVAPIARERTRRREAEEPQSEVDRTPEALGENHEGLTDLPLERNFRSRQSILDLVNEAAQGIPDRSSEKQLRTNETKDEASAGVYTVTVPDEADDHSDIQRSQVLQAIRRLATGETDIVDEPQSLGDIAVLVRSNTQATKLAQRLDEAGLPYELPGGMAAHSPGVETVIAFLKLLANPADDVSLNRILRLRYRLTEPDLRRLNSQAGTTSHALTTADPATFQDGDAVARAQEHVGTLLDVRDQHSLSQLYEDIKAVTDIEWFLTEREREDLQYLDDLIAAFGLGSMQPELTPGFVEYLAVHASTVRDSGGVNAQPELADDAVNIMTVHKSKGLEFKHVLLPHLDQWSPDQGPNQEGRRLLRSLSGDDIWTATEGEFRDQAEERRTLHVAMTRAEDSLVLFGEDSDIETAEKDVPATWSHVQDGCPEPTDGFRFEGPDASFDPWQTIVTSLPEAASDVTVELASELKPDDAPDPRDVDLETVGDNETQEDVDWTDPDVMTADWQAPYREAVETITELAQRMLNDDLPAVDLAKYNVDSKVVEDNTPPSLLRNHSYTSLSTFKQCRRQHYLEYVVGAPSIDATVPPTPSASEDSDGEQANQPAVSSTVVGKVFHDTAEEIANRCLRTDPTDWPLTKDEWERVAKTQCESVDGDQSRMLPAVLERIDALWRTDVVRYDEVIAAEKNFEYPKSIVRDGEDYEFVLRGEIDAVFKRPDGSLAIVDYKTGKESVGIKDYQLTIYTLAAETLFDADIESAGFARLHPDEYNRVDDRPIDDGTTSQRELEKLLNRAAANSYQDADADDESVCRGCDYWWLPCTNLDNTGD